MIERPEHDDDRNGRSQHADVTHRLQPVHAGHEDIEKQQVEPAGLEQRKPLAAIAGDGDVMTGLSRSSRIVIWTAGSSSTIRMLATSEILRAGWGVSSRPQIKPSKTKLLRGSISACKHSRLRR